MFNFIISILGGLFNRLRGSSLVPTSHTLKRIAWAALTAAFGWYTLGIDWEWALGTVPLLWAGMSFGWGEWFNTETWKDVGLLSLRGLGVTLFAGALLTYAYGLPFLAFAYSGLSMGLLYKLGSIIPSKIPHLRQGPEIGELLFGTAVWAALWAATLM